MNDAARRDPVAPLIPWYAAGSLAAAESAQVEEHLAGCDECRDLLALARGFRRLGRQVSQEALFDHVQAQRLVEFAEDPSTLEPEARRFITEHIRTCAPCAEALEILEDLGRSSMAGDPQTTAGHPGTRPASPFGPLDAIRKAMADLWDRLSRTVLRPGPALAYLAALVVLLLSVAIRRSAPAPAPDLAQSHLPAQTAPSSSAQPAPGPPAPFQIALLPPPIDLSEEVDFRDSSVTPAPLRIRRPAAGGTIVFSLVTSLVAEDLAGPAARYRVVLTQGNRTVFERECRGADFDRRGRVLLTLDPATVAAGAPCLARILRVVPGTPSDGEEVYRRSFVLEP